jgi:hypothetical protein
MIAPASEVCAFVRAGSIFGWEEGLWQVRRWNWVVHTIEQSLQSLVRGAFLCSCLMDCQKRRGFG